MRTASLFAAITLTVLLPAVLDAECPGETTREMEDCLAAEREETAASLELYEDEVLRLLSDRPEAKEAFLASQAAWRSYAEAECRAVYVYWQDGSIRNVQLLGCQVQLESERRWSLWSTYLRGMQTELPEPPRSQPP